MTPRTHMKTHNHCAACTHTTPHEHTHVHIHIHTHTGSERGRERERERAHARVRNSSPTRTHALSRIHTNTHKHTQTWHTFPHTHTHTSTQANTPFQSNFSTRIPHPRPLLCPHLSSQRVVARKIRFDVMPLSENWTKFRTAKSSGSTKYV